MKQNNEAKRLQTVRSYLALKVSREEELQNIVNMAAAICESPIGMITMMDDTTQFIRYTTGMNIEQNSRDNSFCQYLVNAPQEDLMIIKDTTQDERFHTHPLVVDDPKLRFYVGAPLSMSDGQHLGTLCVFDSAPKELSPKQQQMMSILSKQVVHILELEMTAKMLQQQLEEINLQKEKNVQAKIKLRSFFESATSCHFLLGREGEIIYYNKSAREFIDLQKKKCMIMSGEKLTAFLSDSFQPVFLADFERSLDGFFHKGDYELLHDDGTKNWWEIAFAPAFNADNEIIGVSFNASYVHESRTYLEKVLDQNIILRKIVTMLSHQFRPAVANIRGVMNLINAEAYPPDNTLLALLNEAAIDLDKNIHEVVKYATDQKQFAPEDRLL